MFIIYISYFPWNPESSPQVGECCTRQSWFLVLLTRINQQSTETLKHGLINLTNYRETIQEDESGRLEPSVTEIIQRTKRRKLLDREASVRLGIMRHVYIILDYSQAMTEQDLKPTRQICTLKVRFVAKILLIMLLWLMVWEIV